jgi:beta-lactamase class A
MSRLRSRLLLSGVVAAAVVAGLTAVVFWRVNGARSAFSPVSLVEVLPTPSFAIPGTTSASADVPGAALEAVVDAAERAVPSGMTVGVAVLDLTTGELVRDGNGGREFFSASLAKLIVVVDMLDRRRSSGLVIPKSDLDLISRALRASDDGAMNALWGTYGGPAAIDRVADRLGLTGTEPPDDVTQWGETEITAVDFTKLYQHILHDMPPEDQQLITGALATAQRTAVDGFDQFFGLLLNGASPQHYAKQGWMTYLPSTQYLHSAGIIHNDQTKKDYAVALLSEQPSVNTQTARTRLSTVANAAIDALGIG